ncbi:MAG: hypothetical protein J5I94_13160 [Phaeodactylibacter sp.]|nr:hypothetical protein [Phaeodactylibacter sp.]
MKGKYNWLNHLLNFVAVILGVYLAFYINEKAKANQDKNESLLLMFIPGNLRAKYHFLKEMDALRAGL